jgi:sodium-dependent dicarboxylate transporter 2/3/5
MDLANAWISNGISYKRGYFIRCGVSHACFHPTLSQHQGRFRMKESRKPLSRAFRIFSGVLLAVAILVLPISGISPQAHRLLAVMVLVVFFWITEPTPLWATSILGCALCILAGVAPAGIVLNSFTDPILLIFIGSFLLARAMHVHGLDNRVAHRLLTHPWVGGNSHRTLWAFGVAAWFLAMWLSITTTVAMLFPAALVIARAVEKTDRRYATALLLMLPYAASAGAMATPIGTPPNLIGIAFMKDILGERIDFLSWIAVGLPVAAILLAVRYGLLLFLFHPPTRESSKKLESLHLSFHAPGAWSHAERLTFVCFLGAVVCWMLGFPPGVVALTASTILFLLPAGLPTGERILRVKDIFHIDWGTVVLFGGGIALGRAIFDTGLGAALGDAWLKPLVDGSLPIFTLATIFAAIIMSEIASNTAAANVVIPIVLSAAGHDRMAGLSLAFAATFGTSLGFMLPVSTPANAMVYGPGFIRLKDMIRAGILVDLAGVPVLWLAVHWLVPLIFN